MEFCAVCGNAVIPPLGCVKFGYTQYVCKSCLNHSKFTKADLKSKKYKNITSSDIRMGKAAYDEKTEEERRRREWDAYVKEHTVTRTFRIDLKGKNKDGIDIQKWLKTEPKKLFDPGDLFQGMLRKSDFKGAKYRKRFYIYAAAAFDYELVEEGDVTRLLLVDDFHLCDLPEDVVALMNTVPGIEMKVRILGGKYKTLDEGRENDRVLTGEEPFYAEISLKWLE